jgi:hypothetical protein
MDASFALALVPALAVLFFVAMPALDRQTPAPKPQPERETARTSAPLRASERGVRV